MEGNGRETDFINKHSLVKVGQDLRNVDFGADVVPGGEK